MLRSGKPQCPDEEKKGIMITRPIDKRERNHKKGGLSTEKRKELPGQWAVHRRSSVSGAAFYRRKNPGKKGVQGFEINSVVLRSSLTTPQRHVLKGKLRGRVV